LHSSPQQFAAAVFGDEVVPHKSQWRIDSVSFGKLSHSEVMHFGEELTIITSRLISEHNILHAFQKSTFFI
jgi:hypothetical protein